MTLKEYEFLQCKYEEKPNYLHCSSFEAIEKFVLDNGEHSQYLKITTKKGYGKVLQAQSFVGVIQTNDGETIEILPKISNVESNEASKNILIKMLKNLKNSPFKSLNTAHLKTTKMPLFEIFITMFLQELSRLIKRGIKSEYLTREENITFLKGKLLLGKQIKYNAIHKERFFVQHQEFLSDRIENRLIKTTLKFLYKKSKLNVNQQRIREFLFVFDEVSSCKDVKNDFLHVKHDRQMKEYTQVLMWCKTFLLGNSFSPYKGAEVAFALLFDMNLLFESYVGAYLQKCGFDVNLQDKTHHLCQEEGTGQFRLKPDIVVNKGQEDECIADTKWKILSLEKAYNGISQQDMYQLYAYGTKYKQCNQMYLIYPKDYDINSRRFIYRDEVSDHLALETLFFDVQNNCFMGDNPFTCKEVKRG